MKRPQWPARSILWLFLLGAFAGTALDSLHVYARVERYAMPLLLGEAWWVPLLFGFATVAIGYSHAAIDPLLGHFRPPQRMLASIGELAWLVLAYLISASELDPFAKLGVLIIIFGNFWLLSGRSWQNLLLSLVTAITGTLIEMMLVASGAFMYLHPDMFGVPIWLPLLYACASLAVGDVGRTLIFSTQRGNHETT